MKRLITIFAAVLICFASGAEDFRPYGSNYYAYPYPEQPLPAQTPPPAGYKPVHMEHYGRHGSRWHIGKGVYTRPVEILAVAERNGQLTPRGIQLIGQLREIELDSRGRDGELTAKGARQHRGIARRMMSNFPELFADSLYINARSTPVHRCILSMSNEMQEMAAANPTFHISQDASSAFLPELNPDDPLTRAYSDSAYHAHYVPFDRSHEFDYDFLNVLFTSPQFVSDSIDAPGLLYHLFIIASNTQSHDNQPSLYDIFTPREIRQKWEHDNLDWFLRSGNTALSGNVTPYSQRNLLRSFIASADTALRSPRRSATMRFGHEVVVLPVAVLMELGNAGIEINDVEQVASKWHNYDIFPMASNIQMVFYRNETDSSAPVLVKVMLNEREVELPAGHITGPYYDWTVLSRYYSDKLNRFDQRFKLTANDSD